MRASQLDRHGLREITQEILGAKQQSGLFGWSFLLQKGPFSLPKPLQSYGACSDIIQGPLQAGNSFQIFAGGAKREGECRGASACLEEKYTH